jgi:hypothetical protein
MTGCICTKRTKNWTDDGRCLTCNLPLSESQIQNAVRLVLCANTDFVLWRNNIGTAIYRDKDGNVASRVEYGIGNPGGADLIGSWRGRFAAIETKSEQGRQTPEQKIFQKLVESKGGLYAIVRSGAQARKLLSVLE